MVEIKVFGNLVKQIAEGQKFVATKTSVEGREVVVLSSLRDTENNEQHSDSAIVFPKDDLRGVLHD